MNEQAQGSFPLGLLLFPNRGLLTCLFRFAKIFLGTVCKGTDEQKETRDCYATKR